MLSFFGSVDVELSHVSYLPSTFPSLLSSPEPRLGTNRVLTWTAIFACIYLLTSLVLKSIKSLNLYQGKKSYLAASRLLGFFHVALVLPMSFAGLFSFSSFTSFSAFLTTISSWNYTGVNTPWEIRTMEVSIGYFGADLIHFLLFEQDVMMFIHHGISLGFFYSVLSQHRGGLSAMSAIVQGEITNPLQSSWYIAKLGQHQQVLTWLSPLFTWAFLIIRGPVITLWVTHIIHHWMTVGLQVVNPFIIYTWSLMCILMTLGGYIWGYKLWRGYKKFNKSSNQSEQPSSSSTSDKTQHTTQDSVDSLRKRAPAVIPVVN